MVPIAGNQKKRKTGWKVVLLVAAMVLFFFIGVLVSEVATFLGAFVIAFVAVLVFWEPAEIENQVEELRADTKGLAAGVAVGSAMIAGGLSTTAVPTILFTVIHTFG